MSRRAPVPRQTGGNGRHSGARIDEPSAESLAVVTENPARPPRRRGRPASLPLRDRLGEFAAIAAGAVLGANARYFAGLWAAERWGVGFPWGTLAINALGSFVLGFFLTLTTERFAGRTTTRLFVATGALGSFTTFSTSSVETMQLLQTGQVLAALGYAAASLLGCLAAVAAGIIAAHLV